MPDPFSNADLMPRLAAVGLRPLRLAGRDLLPIVQGGMGVGAALQILAGVQPRLRFAPCSRLFWLQRICRV